MECIHSGNTFSEMGGTTSMNIENNRLSEQKIQTIIEQLWLTYYNDTLYAKGLITEEQRNKMRVRIKNRTAVQW